MSKKMNRRDRVEGGELDLSMSDLQEVPVREIVQLKKAVSLDLSNNQLTNLGKNFAQLNHLVKLDLSNNQLKSLPDNFGDLVLLKHLDLYSNLLNHLPLSFGQLKNLRWLDLKNNPLVPALAEVAGPCQDSQQCQLCAKKVVKVIGEAKLRLEEEQKKVHQLQKEKEMAEKAAAKKEQQKNKKKEKNEKKKNQENGVKNHNEQSNHDNNINHQRKKERNNKANLKNQPKKPSGSLFRSLFKLIFVLLLTSSTVLLFLYIVDFEKYITVRNGAGYILSAAVDLLPEEVVNKGKQGVAAVRPSVDVAFGKIQILLNQTSTFLNTDPRVKDHWINIKDICSVICERLTDYLRTVYHQIPVYYNDVKNKLIK